MTWTRQHFELIANTVNETVTREGEQINLCAAFADKLQDKNQFFDRDKFMDVCVTGE